ncbi:hypothetical protein BDN71DRAFT_1502550 [Pleurotus eryngii]|uniref:Uncharacterized protein n=1 Tax=Pleurotus eryngii TaxID=5323 RepID=A0A9P6A5Q3_PLEER|nr:hypothetical protein BDN71DRAFT_1502550 [Pleurotus eryngii]
MDKGKYPSQLNPQDAGGVYHNLDGDKVTNLSGLHCEGFERFVEGLQPASGQLAVRCCDSQVDCPVPGPGERCSDVLRGNYGPCGERKEPGKRDDDVNAD